MQIVLVLLVWLELEEEMEETNLLFHLNLLHNSLLGITPLISGFCLQTKIIKELNDFRSISN